MKKLNEQLLSDFLTRYYLLESVCGSLLSAEQKSEIYFTLAKLFCLPECDELNEYYNESNLPHYVEVKDVASYERFCRTLEFAEKSGQELNITECDRIILAQKRKAMSIRNSIFKQGMNTTADSVYSTLLDMSVHGSIEAMGLLSYMEYHGICTCKDTVGAVKRMRVCARWNDLFGNLFGLEYDKGNADEYLCRLNTVLSGEGRRSAMKQICKSKKVKLPDTTDSVARIIEKAFGFGTVHRGLYDRSFAQIAFSSVISNEDKARILHNNPKEVIAAMNTLPFNCKREGTLGFNSAVCDSLPIDRGEEAKKIARNLAVAASCPDTVYMPLLIVSSDPFVSEMYREMIRAGINGCPVAEIDAATLNDRDFFNGKENVFLRTISATKAINTVFIVKNCEALSEEQLSALLQLLDNENKKSFKLFDPPVSFDLSGMTFVLFAGTRNGAVYTLSERCETLWAESVSSSEKATVIDTILEAGAKDFDFKELTIEDTARDYLVSYNALQVSRIIDGVLRNAVFEKTSLVTLEMIKRVCKERNITLCKQGFGYTGGANYA